MATIHRRVCFIAVRTSVVLFVVKSGRKQRNFLTFCPQYEYAHAQLKVQSHSSHGTVTVRDLLEHSHRTVLRHSNAFHFALSILKYLNNEGSAYPINLGQIFFRKMPSLNSSSCDFRVNGGMYMQVLYCIVLYCGRVPAANAPGCTAAEGLLYKP